MSRLARSAPVPCCTAGACVAPSSCCVRSWRPATSTPGAQRVVFEDGRSFSPNPRPPRKDGRPSAFRGRRAGGAGRAHRRRRGRASRPLPRSCRRWRLRCARTESWRALAGEFADAIADAADRHKLDRALLAAMVQVESRLPAARGLSQGRPRAPAADAGDGAALRRHRPLRSRAEPGRWGGST